MSTDHKVLKNIGELLTFEGVAKKDGRKVGPEDLSIVENGSIVLNSEKIEWVGKTKDLPDQYKDCDFEDLEGRTVMPAFVDCHTHLIFGGDRVDEFEMRMNGASYEEIAKNGGGIRSTVKATRSESFEELKKKAELRIQKFIDQGVTTVEIKSGYGLNLETEIKMLEVAKSLKGVNKLTTYLGPHALSLEHTEFKDYGDEILATHLPKIKELELADRVDVFIERGYFDIDWGREYLSKAKNLGFEITVHADQLTRTGASMLGLELGAQSVDHAVEINDEDIKQLSLGNITLVLLPGADFYIKTPYPKARELIDSGARVALATDYNPGSCPSQDIGFMGLLARLEMKMSLPEVLSAFTYGGATALGLQNNLGSISVGKQADFVVLEESWRRLFYSVGDHPIHSVWHRGKKSEKKLKYL